MEVEEATHAAVGAGASTAPPQHILYFGENHYDAPHSSWSPPAIWSLLGRSSRRSTFAGANAAAGARRRQQRWAGERIHCREKPPARADHREARALQRRGRASERGALLAAGSLQSRKQRRSSGRRAGGTQRSRRRHRSCAMTWPRSSPACNLRLGWGIHIDGKKISSRRRGCVGLNLLASVLLAGTGPRQAARRADHPAGPSQRRGRQGRAVAADLLCL